MIDRTQTSFPPRAWLQQSIDAYQFSQCLYVAAKLGIADLLKDSSKNCEQLAQAADADPGALLRLLRALASAGVFERLQNDQFGLNDVSKLLCSDTPGSLRAWAILAGEQPYPAWGHLLHGVKTGGIASDHYFGMSNWQYRSENPSAAEVFNNAMSAMAHASTDAIVEAYDCSRFDCIVDVGGGQGSLLADILKANASIRAVLLDLEAAIQAARDLLAKAGVADRCQVVVGSFLQGVPAGGDAYVLKDILLDWSDADATTILGNCRQAMEPDRILLIVERVIESDQPTLAAAMADLRMMVMNGGRLRSQDGFQALLRGAGFQVTRIIETRSPYRIVEAKSA